MSRESIKNSADMGKQIRSRRNELGLTIEEAAGRAGVGTKTWSRYEAGEPIRKDKYKGVCRALVWQTLPMDGGRMEPDSDVEKYRRDKAWPKDIEEKFGTGAALSFVSGSEILLDYLQEDMSELARLPSGSHIGQIGFSFLQDMLPPQFLTRYDYEFLYALRCNVMHFRKQAQSNIEIIAHSIFDELTLYMVSECSALFFDSIDMDDEDICREWPFELFGDADIVTFLYSDLYLGKGDSFYFDDWMDKQF